MEPRTLDHVAFWVSDREAAVDVATDRLGLHVIDRQENFTLIGSHARHGKLTLFDADGPRDPGALKHVGLRVKLDRRPGRADASERVSRSVSSKRPPRWSTTSTMSPSTRLTPRSTAEAYLDYGFVAAEPRDGVPRVEVGGAFVEFHRGDPGNSERPLLNHLAVLVDSAEDHKRDAEEVGIEVERFVDAANTLAVFVWGPDRVRIEYVEHKPSFSLT